MAAVYPVAQGITSHSGTLAPEIWAAKTLIKFYDATVWNEIANTDYEGEISKFGDTVHIRELNVGEYPYQDLMNLFVGIKYDGWILLEARTNPKDRIAAMNEQLVVFNKMIGKG